MRIFVDMGNTQASTHTSSRPRTQDLSNLRSTGPVDRLAGADAGGASTEQIVPRRLGTQPLTRTVPLPETRVAANELRELLETYLSAMEALLDEHRRTLLRGLRVTGDARAEILAELRALADHRAPWVKALEETRALLYVALREVIVGDNDAGLSLHLAAQPS